MEEVFENFDVHLRRAGEVGTYAAEIVVGSGRGATGEPFQLDQEGLLIHDLDPEAYGLQLFKSVFAGNLRDVLLRETERTGQSFRLRLWLDPRAPELHALPWERIYQIHRGTLVAFAASEKTPFSRFVQIDAEAPEPLRASPLRMLAAFANPLGLPPGLVAVPVEREAKVLRDALLPVLRGGRLKVTLLPGRSGLSDGLRAELEGLGFDILPGATTWRRLRELLDRHPIFHFMGHGSLSRQTDEVALHLEDPDGQHEVVGGEDIAQDLAQLDTPPHLVFLAACETARSSSPGAVQPHVGLGRQLAARVGVPAVVAMQDLVPLDLASELSGRFYSDLFQHGIVDLALNRARRLLFESDRADWAIPVLFTRLPEARLLVADPVLGALEAIAMRTREDIVPLRITVVHVRSRAEGRGPEVPATEGAAALGVQQAIGQIFERDQPGDGGRSNLIALVGGRGMTKSTQVRRVVYLTAAESQAHLLTELGGPTVVPILLQLPEVLGSRSTLRDPAEAAIFDQLRALAPGIEARTFQELQAHYGDALRLRVFFDGGEDLADTERRTAWARVQQLAVTWTDHDYLLAIELAQYDPARLADVTDLLVLQLLSRPAISDYFAELQGLNDLDEEGGEKAAERRRLMADASKALQEALDKSDMWDLAALPWLLLDMLEKAKWKAVPASRTRVLSGLIDGATSEVEESLRSRAEGSLHRLALELATERAEHWPVDRVFRLLAEVRGNREYSLEELFASLVSCGLLSRVAPGGVKFTHDAIHASCVAHALARIDEATARRYLDDAVASLGRPSRLRFWREALIISAGLLPDPEWLLSKLVDGNPLNEGEVLFLASRCLYEARHRDPEAAATPGFVDSPDADEPPYAQLGQRISSALIWRLDLTNEPLTARRARAAEELGRLRDLRTVPVLARIANKKIRPDWAGKPTYERSSLRMAALQALRHFGKEGEDKLEEIDGEVAKVLRWTRERKLEELREAMWTGQRGARGLAAFALADFYSSRFRKPLEWLIELFHAPGEPLTVLWAVTDALAKLEPDQVLTGAVKPLLSDKNDGDLPEETWNNRHSWYAKLAYLIGKARLQSAETDAFLLRCLTELKRIEPKERAIDSIGWLQDARRVHLLEQVARGDLSGIPLEKGAKDDDILYLRRRAIRALGRIGDEERLASVREDRSDWHPDLDRALYQAGEEIASRR